MMYLEIFNKSKSFKRGKIIGSNGIVLRKEHLTLVFPMKANSIFIQMFWNIPKLITRFDKSTTTCYVQLWSISCIFLLWYFGHGLGQVYSDINVRIKSKIFSLLLFQVTTIKAWLWIKHVRYFLIVKIKMIITGIKGKLK